MEIDKIKIWLDVWVIGMDMMLRIVRNIYGFKIFFQDNRILSWSIHHLFEPETTYLIMNMRIPAVAVDKLIWNLTRNVIFTLKSTYNKLREISLGNLQVSLKI